MEITLSTIKNAIPSLFGDSIAGKAITGLARVPALLSSLTAVAMVAELSIRGLSTTLSFFNIGNNPDNWVAKAAEKISVSGIRPYKDEPLKKLMMKTVAFAILGIAGTEFVNLVGGTAPAIYNNVMTYMGPVRIDNASYFTNVNFRPLLAVVGIKV